jgi:hypothetical protein
MATQKRPLTGVLRKPIRLDDAKAGWLKSQFALPRNTDDLKAYVRDEFAKRFVELDEFFGLSSNHADIWEKRAKALIRYEFGFESNGKDWWAQFALNLAMRYVPGFKIKQLNQKKIGRPSKWNDQRLAQLFADVAFLKRKLGRSVSDICGKLPTKSGYEKRWRCYSGDMLRKMYLEAKKRRSDLNFEILLCGHEAVFAPAEVDRIAAAIKRHALKI